MLIKEKSSISFSQPITRQRNRETLIKNNGLCHPSSRGPRKPEKGDRYVTRVREKGKA